MAVLVMLGSFVYPVLVEPLTTDFDPLPAGELRTEILAVADAEGVPIDEVLVSDASRRTTTFNAYVSGFGSTRRVVLYDTLVDEVDQRGVHRLAQLGDADARRVLVAPRPQGLHRRLDDRRGTVLVGEPLAEVQAAGAHRQRAVAQPFRL